MESKKQNAPLLQVQGLTVSFSRYAQGFRRVTLPGVRDLSFSLDEGELVAVVGASGSGKSLLAHRLLGILPHNAQVGGQVLYRGQPLDDRLAGKLRGHEIVLVPQNVSYLDPLMQVREQVKGEKGDAQRLRRRCGVTGLVLRWKKCIPFSCPAAWPGGC